VHLNLSRGQNVLGFGCVSNLELESRLIALGTLKVDNQSRITLTKSLRESLSVKAGDKMAVYQDRFNGDELILKIQRGKIIVQTWNIKRSNNRNKFQFPKTQGDTSTSPASQIPNVHIPPDHLQSDLPVCEPEHNNTDQKLLRVMIIDDEEDILFLFKSVLADTGIYVDAVKDPFEAVKRFVKASPSYYDLVIIDVKMPGINGFQLYRLIRTIDEKVKVLFLTALDIGNDFINTITDWGDRNMILRKPVDQNMLIETVKMLSMR
jgi:CheY-like chemotaxis protein